MFTLNPQTLLLIRILPSLYEQPAAALQSKGLQGPTIWSGPCGQLLLAMHGVLCVSTAWVLTCDRRRQCVQGGR